MFVWGPLCGIQAANPLHKTLYAAFWVRGRERQSQREYWGRGPHTGAGPSYGGGALTLHCMNCIWEFCVRVKGG